MLWGTSNRDGTPVLRKQFCKGFESCVGQTWNEFSLRCNAWRHRWQRRSARSMVALCLCSGGLMGVLTSSSCVRGFKSLRKTGRRLTEWCFWPLSVLLSNLWEPFTAESVQCGKGEKSKDEVINYALYFYHQEKMLCARGVFYTFLVRLHQELRLMRGF